MYEEYEQHNFILNEYEGTLICPHQPKPGNPYIWRTEFLGDFDFADRELLKRGWYLAYYKVSDRFGEPSVIQEMRKFQEYLEQEFDLAKSAALFGFSRGGLYAVNYAAAYPEKVRKLYLDAPALDIFSWPGGFGRSAGSQVDWEICRKLYGIAEEATDAPDNPLNKINTLIENRIPVILVAGDADTVVPFNENGKLLYADYMNAGAQIKLIVKHGVGHHPHSLEQADEIVDWIEAEYEYGCVIDEGPKDWQIFQQTDGFAEVSLSGRCVNRVNAESCNAFVRVVDEEDGSPVLFWQKCKTVSNKWNITLRIPTGGLYRIETCMDSREFCDEWAARGDLIRHIGVGDVFVIAGQSNSAGYGKDQITDSPEMGIHLLKNSGEWDIAAHPMNDSTNTIHPQNRDTANTGQSPYLSFAKYLKRKLGYPIGLVQTALGGSPLSMWSSGGGSLYKSMMETVRPLNGVKAILWYQGCSDAFPDLCGSYGMRFEKMVRDMRAELEMPELPFLTFQINKVMMGSEGRSANEWGAIREAQRRAAETIPNLYVIPTTGGSMSDRIHNSSSFNLTLGERLAKCALGHLYGYDIMCDAPNIKKALKTDAKTIVLEFENVYTTLAWFEEAAKDKIFKIGSKNKYIAPISAEIKRENTIELIFENELPSECVINGAFDPDLPYELPIELATRMPMLSFYGVTVEEK